MRFLCVQAARQAELQAKRDERAARQAARIQAANQQNTLKMMELQEKFHQVWMCFKLI